MVYNGELGLHSRSLVEYLSSIPGTPALPAGANPATWMLQVTGGSMATGGDAASITERYSAAYADSDLAAANHRAAEACRRDPGKPGAAGAVQGPNVVSQDLDGGARRLEVSSKYAQSWWTQLVVLSNKFRVIYWRKPDYNLMRFLMTIVIALALGSTFFGLGDLPDPAELADVQNVLGVLFTSVSFMVRLPAVMAPPAAVRAGVIVLHLHIYNAISMTDLGGLAHLHGMRHFHRASAWRVQRTCCTASLQASTAKGAHPAAEMAVGREPWLMSAAGMASTSGVVTACTHPQ